jgi:hypothetical protein
LLGAAAASTVGYTLPGLIYFRTYENDFHSMLQTVRTYCNQRGLFSSGSISSQHRHVHLRDSDEEDSHDRHEGILTGADVWKVMRPFFLPTCMVIFGILSMIIGIATILSS